jgi:hypothetical protein
VLSRVRWIAAVLQVCINVAYFTGFEDFTVVMCTALLVGGSRDRSPVVSLGIFSEAPTEPCALGLTEPLKMSTRNFLGVKAAGA